jgi:hypothetical protein
MRDEVAEPSREMLRFAGRPLTVVTRTNPVQDERHRDVHWDSEERVDTTGEVAERGTPSFQKRANSVDVDVDLFVWLPGDVSVTTGDDDQNTPSTHIEDGDRTYRVYEVYPEDNGLVRCHCVKHD